MIKCIGTKHPMIVVNNGLGELEIAIDDALPLSTRPNCESKY